MHHAKRTRKEELEAALAEQRAPLILQSLKWQKLLINDSIEHDSFSNAQQVSVSKAEDKKQSARFREKHKFLGMNSSQDFSLGIFACAVCC